MTQLGTGLNESLQLQSSSFDVPRPLLRSHFNLTSPSAPFCFLPFSSTGGQSKKHSPVNLQDTDPYFRFCFLGNSTSNICSPSLNIAHPARCSNRPCSLGLSVFELYQLSVWMSEPSHPAHAPPLWWRWLWQMDGRAHKPNTYYLVLGRENVPVSYLADVPSLLYKYFHRWNTSFQHSLSTLLYYEFLCCWFRIWTKIMHQTLLFPSL